MFVKKTLCNWCGKLSDLGIITRAGFSSAWVTTVNNGRKTRRRLQPEEDVAMEEYFRRRGELQREYYRELVHTLHPADAKNEAYRRAYRDLWDEYSCCFYYCKALSLGLNFEQYADEVFQIYELVDEINPDFTFLAHAAPAAANAETENLGNVE